ncbi:MAG: family 43 glycosylhydrolase [Micromonosporaceae bacterium]|nr:family 43 glycosylhydrolase [Micromonosporaceae bacterium]
MRFGWVSGAAILGLAVVPAVPSQPAAAVAPAPVYAPLGGVADPGVVRTGGDFYVFATGSDAPVYRGDQAAGPWSPAGPALTGAGAWATSNAVWAPDAVQTSAGWVLYYSAPALGMNGQRCIGVATASSVAGPYTPNSSPLICPGGENGAVDTVPGRPVVAAGVIDPSPFQDSDGHRFVLYKTQQTPSSLRMLRLNDAGTDWIGNPSGELIRNSGIIENPAMVQQGSTFVLFASRFGFDNCSYATVYHTSTDKWNFAGTVEHSLLTSASTGLCGPGGADVTPSLDGGWRIFLHAWVCSGTTPCVQRADGSLPAGSRRVLYAAVLNWSGATPSVGAFL